MRARQIAVKGFALLVLALASAAWGTTLEEGFIQPPPKARPQVWWWFSTYNEASDACVTRDLEAMKAVGISGFHIYGGWNNPTPQWRAKVRWALHEASRLGLEAVICIGNAGCDSDFTKPEFAQKELTFSETRVNGPGRIEVSLPRKGAARTPKNPDGSPRYFWDIAVFAVPDGKNPVPRAAVRDISQALDAATGKLVWEVPAGAWRILRIGCAPNIFGWSGCYIDHMSRQAFDEHWRITMAPLLNEMQPDERRALKGVLEDSWEAGSVSWTQTFAEEFQRRRGYSVMPWLPALAGVVLDEAAQTARFQRDFKETISELIAENHYAYLTKVANEHGLVSIVEAAGPHQHQADVLRLSGRGDVSMGEVWMPSAHRPTPPQRFMVRDAATSAHLYGIPEVLSETFTTIDTYWIESPATMKPTVDRAFCDGLNHVCYHGMMLSPSLTARPGMIRNVGTQYNPQLTWWPQSAAFNLYLSRCSWMLQQGVFVADALIYHGDNLDMFAGLKTPAEALGAGFDYDYCNSEILERAAVRDGGIVLPSGMRYRVLILSQRNPKAARMEAGNLPPQRPLPPVNPPLTLAALRKIAGLVKAGTTVIGERPTGPAGLTDDRPAFEKLADELWGTPGVPPEKPVRPAGKGRVITSFAAARAVLEQDGLKPDFTCDDQATDDAIDWIHRASPAAEIYFIANRSNRAVQKNCVFRVAWRTPELWNPVTGERNAVAGCQQTDGGTMMPLDFAPGESWFVVFRETAGKTPPAGIRQSVSLKPFQEINGPWKVQFDPQWGGPAAVVFPSLQDWTQRPEEGIRHYSGTAIYRCTFEVNEAGSKAAGPVFLDLGAVQVVAEVSLNGQPVDTLWTPPWRVEVTRLLKPGPNVLEIRVTNLWPNRLIGDTALPPEKRFTQTNLNKYQPDSPLLPSGLLGPVRLVSAL